MNRLKFLVASAYLWVGLLYTGWLFDRDVRSEE